MVIYCTDEFHGLRLPIVPGHIVKFDRGSRKSTPRPKAEKESVFLN